MLDHIQRSALELVALGRTQADVAAELGIRPRTLSDWVRRRAARGEIGGPPIPEIGRPPEGFVVARNNAEYDADGTLTRQWVATKRDAGDVFEMPAGHVVKGVSALLDADGREMARWVKTREDIGGADLVAGLKTAFAEYSGRGPIIDPPAVSDEDLLTVYALPDLHLGQLSWGRETGESYDLKIATETAINAVETLVARSMPSRHAVILGLGDYFHTDDQRNITPGSGHQLDADCRWAKIFASGAKLATAMVDIIARKHHFVEARFLSGNHDINSAMCLTVALSLFYNNNERITVNSDPGIAWYRRFGACLLGGTHGHSVKMDKMPLMMAADRPEDWGLSRHRSMFSGHIHTETSKELGGVRVESLQAMTARDAWNAASGYRSGRSLSAITFHAEDGEAGRHRVNISGHRAKVAA